ncbi:MAG: permease-like cell division protein FtsX [Neisseria sp.]|nr:permease-like cell division protein FtsX [Neisseria sp.]
MIRYLSLHLDAAGHAAVQLLKQPLATLLVLLMLAVAMSLPLALYLGIAGSRPVLGKLNESPQITLYLEQEAGPADHQAISGKTDTDPRIAKSEFIGKAQGLGELQTNMGEQDLVSMLDDNPLPDVFVITPRPGSTPEQIQTLRQDLAAMPMVESARLDTEWMQTLYRIDSFVRQVLAFLSVTLSVAFALVAYNTIRLQILSRKEEIEITKLLGAPASFIRRPFLYQAAWQSLLAAGISLGLCAWLIEATRPLVADIFRPYGLNIEWRFFHLWEWLAVLGIVAALGIAGAWLATRRHLLRFEARR